MSRAFDLLDGGCQADKLSFTMADDLDGMVVFVAVAETKGFRAAGQRLHVSGSAVSQALRRLEERLWFSGRHVVFVSPRQERDCTPPRVQRSTICAQLQPR